MRVAALDLGTNTFILLVAEVKDGRIKEVLHDEVRVVRLGQGVHEARAFHPDALARAEACLADYRKVINRFSVERVLACATSAARDVSNGDALIQIASHHDIPVKIIEGEVEADFTFWGTVRDDLESPVLIVDIGGGSTELIIGDRSGLISRMSLDIGAVRLTEMFVKDHPIPIDQLQSMTAYIQERIREARARFPSEGLSRMIAVAGTPTTLATLEQMLPFETERVDGFLLPVPRVRFWVQRLAGMTIEERQGLAGMEPKRADVIVAGALILMLVGQAFGIKEIEVSTRGLRYGVARHLAMR